MRARDVQVFQTEHLTHRWVRGRGLRLDRVVKLTTSLRASLARGRDLCRPVQVPHLEHLAPGMKKPRPVRGEAWR